MFCWTGETEKFELLITPSGFYVFCYATAGGLLTGAALVYT